MSRIFVAYIRPLLEYASQLWSPSTIDFINRIERVQRMFTKHIRSISHMTYDERFAHLNLHRLECRRLYLDMLFLGKLKYNIIHLSLHDFSVQNFTLHNYRFISLPSSNRKSFYFVTVRSVRLWNSMHHDVTSARNFALFAVFCIMLILYLICGGVFDGSFRAFTLLLYLHLPVHLSIHEINKKKNIYIIRMQSKV